MQTMAKNFIATVILVSAVITISAQTPSAQTAATPATNVVCGVDDIPKGFVIVGYQPSATCKGGFNMMLKSAEDWDVVCAYSPLPPGFSVFSRTNAAACNAGNTSASSNAVIVGRGRSALISQVEAVNRNGKMMEEKERVNTNMEILDKALKDCAYFNQGGLPRRVPVRCKVSSEVYMKLVALPRIENAEQIELTATQRAAHESKVRPEPPSRKNEHWAQPTCESLFKIAADANLDLIGNEDRAKQLYSKKEWKVLAPCLVELRKAAHAKA